MNFESLFSHSSMEIYEFAINTRDIMESVDRVLPYYVMSYLKEGEALLRMRGKEYRHLPQTVVFIPAGVKHDHVLVGKGPATFLWWHFNLKLYQTLDFLRILRLPVAVDMKNNLAFETTFQHYIELSEASATLCNVVLKKAKALEIMAILLETAENAAISQLGVAVPDDFYTMLEAIITGNDNEDVSLEAFSKRFNLHPTYISNRFSKLFGITPIALFRQIQVQRATSMLTDRNMSVGDVAAALGFKDSSTFSRFYSSKTGKSPTQAALEKRKEIVHISV